MVKYRKRPFLYGWRKIVNVSFGMVAVTFLLFMVFNYSEYISVEDQWPTFLFFLSYSVLIAVYFSNADVRNIWFGVKFRHFIPRFFVFFVPSFIILFVIMKSIFGLTSSVPFYNLVFEVPIIILLMFFFVVSALETAVWQGFLDDPDKSGVGLPYSSLLAGLFHMNTWEGPILLVVFSSGLLFLGLSYFNWLFRKDRFDVVPAMALHFAFDLAFLISVVLAGGNLQ